MKHTDTWNQKHITDRDFMSAQTHIDQLEAEAIYIMREVAAECEKPVMLYYPTLALQITDPSILCVKGNEGRETTELLTKLNKWNKERRFIVARILKPEKDRMQISLIEGEEYQCFFFVTNTELTSEKVVILYEKRGNCENYIKEAMYDMAVGHLLLKSFWSNEAVFQMLLLAYNLFLLFKFDFFSI